MDYHVCAAGGRQGQRHCDSAGSPLLQLEHYRGGWGEAPQCRRVSLLRNIVYNFFSLAIEDAHKFAVAQLEICII